MVLGVHCGACCIVQVAWCMVGGWKFLGVNSFAFWTWVGCWTWGSRFEYVWLLEFGLGHVVEPHSKVWGVELGIGLGPWRALVLNCVRTVAAWEFIFGVLDV